MAKGRWNQRGSKWEGKMKGDLRLRDQEGPHSVIRAEPRLPDLGVFSDLKGEGRLFAGKQSCGQEAALGSRVGNKPGRLRGRKNRTKQTAKSKQAHLAAIQ